MTEMHACGLPRQQAEIAAAAILAILTQYREEQRATEICEYFKKADGIALVHITRILGDLDKEGSVQRIPKEGRAATYLITNKGLAAARRLGDQVRISDIIETLGKAPAAPPINGHDLSEKAPVTKKRIDPKPSEAQADKKIAMPIDRDHLIKDLLAQAREAPAAKDQDSDLIPVLQELRGKGYSIAACCAWLRERGVEISDYRLSRLERTGKKEALARNP